MEAGGLAGAATEELAAAGVDTSVSGEAAGADDEGAAGSAEAVGDDFSTGGVAATRVVVVAGA
jgi:hypothetical protein